MRQAIIDWTEEDGVELAAHIDDFIRAAELRIFREVDLEVFRSHMVSQANPGDPFITLPTGADIIVRDFHLTDATNRKIFLLRKHSSFIYDFWPDAGLTGEPRFYSRWLYNVLYVAPTPDFPYSLEIEISKLPDSIVPINQQSNSQTWLGDNAWDALLWGSLIEAVSFMKADTEATQAPVWQTKYAAAIERLGVQERRERLDDFRNAEPR